MIGLPPKLVYTFIPSVWRILWSLFWIFQFSADFSDFLGGILSFFKNRPKFHQKSPRNQLKMEISKKGSIGSSTLMGWRYKPILGAIQSSSSEKAVPTLNFKAKFYNMGNPIHFATSRDTSQLPKDRSRPKIDIFQFRKKFLNPCNSKFWEL